MPRPFFSKWATFSSVPPFALLSGLSACLLLKRGDNFDNSRNFLWKRGLKVIKESGLPPKNMERKELGIYSFLVCFFAIVLFPVFGISQEKSDTALLKTNDKTATRDGQHDFDFEIGTWKTKLSRLVNPLAGSDKWVQYEGVTVVKKVMNGKANLVELVADGPTGHFEGISLRLYNPQSRQWSLNFANIRNGTLSIPTVGEFKDGHC